MKCIYCQANTNEFDDMGFEACKECASELLNSGAKTLNRRRRWLIRYYARKYRFVHGQLVALRTGMAGAHGLHHRPTPPPTLTGPAAGTPPLLRAPARPHTTRGVTYDARAKEKPYLARYQLNERKFSEYFTTLEEAVGWLETNNPNYRKRP